MLYVLPIVGILGFLYPGNRMFEENYVSRCRSKDKKIMKEESSVQVTRKN